MFRAFSACRSTHLLSRMGGTHGRTLLQGDRLGLGVEGTPNRRRKPIPDATAYGRGGGARLRVLPGPQTDYFPDEAMDLLQRTRFIISPQSNRMGYRLQGDGIPAAARAGDDFRTRRLPALFRCRRREIRFFSWPIARPPA